MILALLLATVADGGFLSAPKFHSTLNAPVVELDGGGREAGFMCTGMVNGAPCLSNPYGIVEMQGSMVDQNNDSMFVCNIEQYALPARTHGCIWGFGNGATSYKGWTLDWQFNLRTQGDITLTNTTSEVHFVAEASRLQVSGGGPVANGPAVYFRSNVPILGGALFEFYNYNVLKVGIANDGAISTVSARNHGTFTMPAGGTNVIEVKAGAVCTCKDQTDDSSLVCPVAVSAAAFIGTAGHSISYVCL